MNKNWLKEDTAYLSFPGKWVWCSCLSKCHKLKRRAGDCEGTQWAPIWLPSARLHAHANFKECTEMSVILGTIYLPAEIQYVSVLFLLQLWEDLLLRTMIPRPEDKSQLLTWWCRKKKNTWLYHPALEFIDTGTTYIGFLDVGDSLDHRLSHL